MRRHWLALLASSYDRIVLRVRMGGLAFVLLKAGPGRAESAKQAEIRLAVLLKILGNWGRPGRKFPAEGTWHMQRLYLAEFPRDMANSSGIEGFVI
jgi:hypothetical protein